MSVVAKARHDKSDSDVIAAFRSLGTMDAIDESTFRFDWDPILASFESEVQVGAGSDIQSTVTRSGPIWRWKFDAYPFTTGRVLWRMANALRFLTMLSLWTDRGVFADWFAEYEGTVIATVGPASGPSLVVTETFANVVAGEVGKAALAAMQAELGAHIRREDERTLESERNSSLIATFVIDQLAVRPPISESEINALKRRLGIE